MTPDRSKDRFEGTHRPETGPIEVFWSDESEPGLFGKTDDQRGWFWWSCYPGCLPDSDPVGPFESSREAYEDAVGQEEDTFDGLPNHGDWVIPRSKI